ncbi:MAG: hypothetical protein ABIA21_03670, partial [Candidatus Aenigmatarchaeota archaeon]
MVSVSRQRFDGEMMKAKIAVMLSLLLIAVLISSGCVDQNTEVRTSSIDGIVITTLGAEPSTLEKEDVVDLTVEIENQGAVDATNVALLFTGIEEQWRTATSPYETINDSLPRYYARLKAPQEDQNIGGDFKSTTIRIKPPGNIPPGQPATPYSLGVMVFYDYKTTGVITAKAYELDYWRNVLKGVAPVGDEIATVHSSDAPVKLELDPDYITRPITVSFEDSPIYERSFKLILSNVGSGYPVQEYGKITGKLSTTGAFKFGECGNQVINNNSFTITPELQDIVKLKGSNSKSQ